MKQSKIHFYKSYCSEPLDKIEHYEEALAEGFAGWCIHHRLEIQPDGTRVSAKELIDQNLYYGRPASELVFMRFGEHSSLHRSFHNIGNTYMKGKHHTEKTRQKISEALKGKHLSEEHRHRLSEALKGKHHTEKTRQKMSEALLGENNPLFGKHRSAETRQKISESLKGKHNCTKDSLWWNDGISNKRSKECPGPEWKRGCLKKTGQA